jgi:SAM-dependent methyltransferase
MQDLLKIAKENGFSSTKSMDSYHTPIIKFSKEIISLEGGNTLDLGCGNGFLLKRIKEINSSVIPYGIELNDKVTESAKKLQEEFQNNFFSGNLIDAPSIISENLKFELVIIMPGRLLEEKDNEKKRCFLNWLKGSSKNILAYAYGDWVEKYGSLKNILDLAGFDIIKEDNKNNLAIVRVK